VKSNRVSSSTPKSLIGSRRGILEWRQFFGFERDACGWRIADQAAIGV
jgi:hypothetical protein